MNIEIEGNERKCNIHTLPDVIGIKRCKERGDKTILRYHQLTNPPCLSPIVSRWEQKGFIACAV